MPAATQVEVLLKWDGGNGKGKEDDNTKGTNGAGAKPSAGAGEKPKADVSVFKKIGGGINKFVKGQLGLNFGISALVKQSQIFTSTVGVIFQLLGALVDVMLAPLIPLFLPLIRLLGNAIPFVQRNIVPMIESIVAWLLGFLGSWDGSWDMLKKELLGLGEKFTIWWDGTASPFLKKRLEDVQNWIGTKITDFWDWFKGADTRVQGWVTEFFIGQTAKVLGWLLRLPMFLLKLLFKLPGFLFRAAGTLTKMMFPIIGDAFVSLVTHLSDLFTWIKDKIFGAAKNIVVDLYKSSLDLLAKLFNKMASIVSGLKLPFGLGGKLESMFKNVAKGATEMKAPKEAMKKLGTKLVPLAKMSKAIPVLGSVATAGFGTWEVIQSVKSGDYEKALFLAGKTVAATTLTAFGHSIAGLAVDVGGTLAAGAIFKDTGDKTAIAAGIHAPTYGVQPYVPPDPNILVTINNFDQEGTLQAQQEQAHKMKDMQNRDIAFELNNETS